MSRPPLGVVFAVLNHGATLRALLDALQTTDWPDLRLCAVDCGSTDGSLELLHERASAGGPVPLQVLERPGAGRATALNAGFAALADRDVVRIHADVVPDGDDWLANLVAVTNAHPDWGVVGAKIVLAGGRIQTCGRNLINGLGIVPEWSDRRWLEADRDEPCRALEVDGVGGELCLYRRTLLDATGGLDPGYDPVFGDDDDFCLLARWHGHAVYVEPGVRGVHHAPRASTTTNPALPDRTGLLQRLLDDRARLQGAHRHYFQQKWGFDPSAPDLHEVRRRYGHTRICWRIGTRLTESLPPQPAVDVCLVTWNSLALLPRAMAALAATRYPALQVWITDNGSTDGTVAYLRELAATFPFPLHLEVLPQNLGVAQALNLAFARGTAPLVARLDDDTVVSPEWLERLVPRFHQRPYAGMVGPQVLHDNPATTLQSGPNREFPHGFPGLGPDRGATVTGLCRTTTIRGCCNVYRRSVFREVGLLDVRFSPSQFDEWDHHIAMAVAGYEALYDGSVTVRHLLTAGRMATPASIANFRANLQKSNAKWGQAHWEALDRGIDLSIDGRLLPADGDTRTLRAALPPVPDGPPRPLPRDPAEQRELTAIGRRRSLLRGLRGPLQAWWDNQITLGEESLGIGSAITGAMVTKLMDLLPQDPRALLMVAAYRAREGDYESATRTVRWAARLRPDDADLAARVAAVHALLHGERPVPAAPQCPTPVDVLLVPPFDTQPGPARLAAEVASRALTAVGAKNRIETALQPETTGARIVHCFGLGDPATLVARLQYLRATAPQARLVLSPLAADPGPANWYDRVLGQNALASDADLREVLAAAVRGQVTVDGRTERSVPGNTFAGAEDYERRAFTFVDDLVVCTEQERTWLASRQPWLPPIQVVAEGVPTAGAPADPRLPHGGVLALGPRDVPGNHLAMVLALAGGNLPLTLCGPRAHPYADWRTAQRWSGLRFVPQLELDQQFAACRRSAVLLWLPASPTSFLVPLLAAAAGCELVLAAGVGAEAWFGPHASYVDPCDLPGIRSAVTAAAARWQGGAIAAERAPWLAAHSLPAYGRRLLASYGLAAAPPAHPPHRALQPT